MNCWIILRLLAKYGDRAKQFVEQDENRDPMEKSKTRAESRVHENWYRTEEIGKSDKEAKLEQELKGIEQQLSTTRYELDDNNNLIQCNEYGDIEEIHYVNVEQENEGLYEQVNVVTDEERIRQNVQRNRSRINMGEIQPDW